MLLNGQQVRFRHPPQVIHVLVATAVTPLQSLSRELALDAPSPGPLGGPKSVAADAAVQEGKEGERQGAAVTRAEGENEGKGEGRESSAEVSDTGWRRELRSMLSEAQRGDKVRMWSSHKVFHLFPSS